MPEVRPRGFVEWNRPTPDAGSCTSHYARAQNFLVHWIDAAATAAVEVASEHETLLLTVQPDAGVVIERDGEATTVPGSCVALIAPGSATVHFPTPTTVIRLVTHATSDEWAQAVNAADYDEPDPRVKPVGRPMLCGADDPVRVHRMADVEAAPVAAGIKVLQSGTMTINWVEAIGPRDRHRLSPHSHADFEQGSLAVVGAFVHHLRVPWEADADRWRADEPLEAPGGSLTVMPVELVHTTEWIAPGRNLLIDVFAPIRTDFRAAGWVANGDDYD